ncbi:MAG: DnaJ domain-containing protein [Lactobacillus sp.]|jgi:hypothetical protein|nr:DnaJ domain-containing protein [Lactobacillus sp.]
MIKPTKTKRAGKYFTPQSEGSERKCDCNGCTKKGEYRAPKDRSLKEYYWFCLDHVQEYNAKWNYYEGISSDAPEEEFNTQFKSRVKYKRGFNIKDSTGFFGEYASDFSNIDEIFYSREEKEYLKLLELDTQSLDVKNLKKQYKKLAKKYHPDTNLGDKKMEEKFKQLTHAYNYLLKKIS